MGIHVALDKSDIITDCKYCRKTDRLAWDEKRRFYDPLADRDDMFIGKYD